MHPKLSQQQVVGEDPRPRLSLGRRPHQPKSGATIWDAPLTTTKTCLKVKAIYKYLKNKAIEQDEQILL